MGHKLRFGSQKKWKIDRPPPCCIDHVTMLFCFGERFSRDRASRGDPASSKSAREKARDQPGKLWISYNFYMKSKWTVFQASAKQTVKIYSIMQPTFLLSKWVKYDAKLIFIDRLINRKHMSLIATQQQRWHRVPHLHIRSCPSMQMRQFDLLTCRKKRQSARVTSWTVRLSLICIYFFSNWPLYLSFA